MTNDPMAERELLQKGSDASPLRKMSGFADQRLMKLQIGPLYSGAAQTKGATG